MARLDAGAECEMGETVTADEHAAMVQAEKDAERRSRRNLQDRARRAAATADAAKLAQAVSSGRAIKPMLSAAAFLSRRGVRLLRGAAMKGDMRAMRMLIDLTKTLALIEFAAKEREGRQQEPERPRRQVIATWPGEGAKS
jgi:hypothetical protein